MKKIIFGIVAGLAFASFVKGDGTNLLSDEKSRVSYALGMLTGHSWSQQGVDFDVDTYARGIKDGASGGATLLTPEQAQQVIATFRMEFTARQQQKNVEFLATNKNNPGVQTLSDGLQYLVVTKGSGATPAPGDTVVVNYRGTLVDGSEFDNSYKRGQPFQFRLGVDPVILGWTEALQKMTVGSKWKLFIPSELAYGEKGRPGIPPNATLIFEVQLIDTKPSAPRPMPAPPAPMTSDIIKVQGTNYEIIKAGAAGVK